jgi:hypothetical protein
MRESLTEVIVGAVVLVTAVGFLAYAAQATGFADAGGNFKLTASFRSIEGVTVGTDVRLAGVKIGTVTETIDAIRLTQSAGWAPVVSARSGETEDTFIAHLAVATNAGQLKVGSFCRSERMAKWNEVLRIGRHLGPGATFAGKSVLAQNLVHP